MTVHSCTQVVAGASQIMYQSVRQFVSTEVIEALRKAKLMTVGLITVAEQVPCRIAVKYYQNEHLS